MKSFIHRSSRRQRSQVLNRDLPGSISNLTGSLSASIHFRKSANGSADEFLLTPGGSSPIPGAPALRCHDLEFVRIAFANMLDYLKINNWRSSETPEPIATMCKNRFIASIELLYVFPTDKGENTGVHPYNRILARA
jgi:hypothetical protein